MGCGSGHIGGGEPLFRPDRLAEILEVAGDAAACPSCAPENFIPSEDPKNEVVEFYNNSWSPFHGGDGLPLEDR